MELKDSTDRGKKKLRPSALKYKAAHTHANHPAISLDSRTSEEDTIQRSRKLQRYKDP